MTTVCLGDVFVDVIARLPGPLRRGSDTPAPVTLVGGGSAANTAAWIAATGGAARLIGAVGPDLLGAWAMENLRGFGIDLRLTVSPVAPTGTCIVLVDPDGERTMVPAPGASGELRFNPRLLDGGSALHVSGYALFGERSREAALAALIAAESGQLPRSIDAASAAPLERFGPARLLNEAAGCLLFANRDEAELLLGTACASAAAAAEQLGAQCAEAIVKDGASGAAWSDGASVVSVPAVPVAGPIDSTGAGDAFAAGVLGARATGASPSEQLRRGADFAARALGRTGGRPPTGHERE